MAQPPNRDGSGLIANVTRNRFYAGAGNTVYAFKWKWRSQGKIA